MCIRDRNNARIDNYLLSEPGLSLLIEAKDKKILFDTGYSDVFIKNAETLGLDLGDITDIVISHGHNDHTRGLTYFELHGVPLIAHPNIFDTKIDENKIHYGCPIAEEELGRRYRLNLTNRPFWLNNEFVFLGEIPENKSADIDDTSLVHKTNEGIFIITGCSQMRIRDSYSTSVLKTVTFDFTAVVSYRIKIVNTSFRIISQ